MKVILEFESLEAMEAWRSNGSSAEAPTPIEDGEVAKRKRRTKAEMEADAAKQAAPVVGAPTVAPTTPANYQLVLDAMTKYVQSFPDGQAGYDAGAGILKEFGVDKCSALKQDQWAPMLARLQAPKAPTASSLLG